MSRKSYRQAINEAMRQEMERDSSVILMGEDVSGGTATDGEQDAWGGPFGVTKGLYTQFGPTRVLDTHLAEMSFIGAAVGAAATGMRPIAELMYIDFIGVCLDQLMNQAAKFRYMFGGKATTPLVIRTSYGVSGNGAAQHSQALYPIMTHIPGLKVVLPSSPYEAKGLLIQAIRDNDPVIFFENRALYDMQGEVPDQPYAIPFGQANVLREGDDVTIVAFGRMVSFALSAADAAQKLGISCTVVDPRTTSPLDAETILETVAETGRLVVVDEATPRCSMATDIVSLVSTHIFGSLKSAPQVVTAPHSPVPFSPTLESLYLPSVEKIITAILAAAGKGPLVNAA
jgi:pyruvate/2-oxoglutarate/acetoin dehydrogenase E1 component